MNFRFSLFANWGAFGTCLKSRADLHLLNVVTFLSSIFLFLSCLRGPEKIIFGDFYLLGILFLTAVLGLISYKSRFHEPERANDIILFMALAVFSGFMRFVLAEEKSIWPDEGYHIFFNQGLSPYQASIRQVNPPLLSVFNNLILSVAEFSENKVRFVSLASYSGSIFALGLLFRKIGLDYLLSCALLLVFSLHPLVVLYSLEARPVMLGIFTTILFLFSFWNITIIGVDPSRLFQLFSSMLILFLSVGFQSYIMGFSAGIVLLILGYFEKKYLFAALFLFSAFLLFYPIQVQIVSNSRFHINDIFSVTEIKPIWIALTNQSRIIFEYFFKPIVISALFLALSVPFWRRYSGQMASKKDCHWFFYNLFICIGLFVIFLPLLSLFIREQFEVYHFANVFISVLVVCGWLFKLIVEKMRNEYRSYFMMTVSLALIFSTFSNLIYPNSFSDDFYRSDLKSAILEMVNDVGAERNFYLTEVCLRGSETWCPDEPFYVNFYLKTKLSDRQGSNSFFPKKDVLKFHRDSFVKPFKIDRIYFLIHDMKPKRREKLLKYMNDLPNAKTGQTFISSEGYVIFGYPSESSDSRLDILSGLNSLLGACGLYDSDCYWVKATLALMTRSMVTSSLEAQSVQLSFRREFFPPKASFHRGADVNRILNLLEGD